MKLALALALTGAVVIAAASAEAPRPMRGLLTRPVAAARININAIQKAAPRPYTKQQTAQAIANALKLAIPPTLGEAITLTPADPSVPNLAGMWFNYVEMYVSGSTGNSSNPTGLVGFTDKSSSMGVYFHAQQGKRYAIDCRTTATRVYYSAWVGDQANFVNGETTTDIEHHALFAIGPSPASDWLYVRLGFTDGVYNPPLGGIYTWGCDITPF
jgi:hypothetical protein